MNTESQATREALHRLLVPNVRKSLQELLSTYALLLEVAFETRDQDQFQRILQHMRKPLEF